MPRYRDIHYSVLMLDTDKYKWIVIGNIAGVSGSGTSSSKSAANRAAKNWIDKKTKQK